MNRMRFTIGAALIATLLAGCGQTGEKPIADASQQTQQLQAIDVSEVAIKPVQSWHTYTTRLEAPNRVVLRPRVSGQITEVLFEEGQRVEKGALLFSIDPRPFKARVENLEAQLVSAEAVLDQARREAARAKQLLTRHAISTEQADQRDASQRQAAADRNAIAAQLESAKLDLEFSQVKAPIDGVISRALATEGNFVSMGRDTLTTLVSDHKVHAYFDIDERTWLRDFSEVKAHDHVAVSLERINGGTPVTGHIDFIDNEINATTGTLRVRGVFDARRYNLKPGAFARVSLASSQVRDLAIVPDRAIGTDLKNRFVLVLDEQNVLHYRKVELGERYGAFRAIEAGLQSGDRIATNGAARVGAGMPVAPRNTDMDFTDTQFVLESNQDTVLLSATF